MKINPNSAITNQVISERKTHSVSTSETAASKLGMVDRTTLSTSLPSVASLTKQAMQTPSVRQEKVSALREAISSGAYSIDNSKIAAGLTGR